MFSMHFSRKYFQGICIVQTRIYWLSVAPFIYMKPSMNTKETGKFFNKITLFFQQIVLLLVFLVNCPLGLVDTISCDISLSVCHLDTYFEGLLPSASLPPPSLFPTPTSKVMPSSTPE